MVIMFHEVPETCTHPHSVYFFDAFNAFFYIAIINPGIYRDFDLIHDEFVIIQVPICLKIEYFCKLPMQVLRLVIDKKNIKPHHSWRQLFFYVIAEGSYHYFKHSITVWKTHSIIVTIQSRKARDEIRRFGDEWH